MSRYSARRGEACATYSDCYSGVCTQDDLCGAKTHCAPDAAL